MRTRNSFTTGRGTFAFVAMSAMAGSAMAQPLDFDFQQLDSSFSTSTSIMNILAVDQPAWASQGSVRRNDPPAGIAGFLPGFISGLDPADFNMSLLITAITPASAQASGTMSITDVDGDSLNALITGTFAFGATGNTLTATITNVVLTSDEDLFDGPDGGVFSTVFAPGVLSSGTISGTFVTREALSFDQDFENVGASVAGVIPAPSGAAVLALAGLAAARRRRA